jgi:hypothetical protein
MRRRPARPRPRRWLRHRSRQRPLATRGLDVFGIDLSPGMVELARHAYPHLRFDVGALEDLTVADATLGGLLARYS